MKEVISNDRLVMSNILVPLFPFWSEKEGRMKWNIKDEVKVCKKGEGILVMKSRHVPTG